MMEVETKEQQEKEQQLEMPTSFGVFGLVNFEAGEFMHMEYTGARLTDEQDIFAYDSPSRYIVQHKNKLLIDAQHCGNETRFINDFRDVPVPVFVFYHFINQ